MKIILGSASLRRQELLKKINVDYEVYISNIDEDLDIKNPIKYALKIAHLKGIEVLSKNPDCLVITADTIVKYKNEILGKPKSEEDAFLMLKKISGKTHFVITAVFIGDSNEYDLFYEKTKVKVNLLTDQEIKDYLKTKEAYDKAGAYAIQGEFGKYIKKIKGDYYNVVGLPLNKVYKNLKLRGIL